MEIKTDFSVIRSSLAEQFRLWALLACMFSRFYTTGWILGKISFLQEWSAAAMGCPEGWWSHNPWRCSSNVQMLYWGIWLKGEILVVCGQLSWMILDVFSNLGHSIILWFIQFQSQLAMGHILSPKGIVPGLLMLYGWRWQYIQGISQLRNLIKKVENKVHLEDSLNSKSWIVFCT